MGAFLMAAKEGFFFFGFTGSYWVVPFSLTAGAPALFFFAQDTCLFPGLFFGFKFSLLDIVAQYSSFKVTPLFP